MPTGNVSSSDADAGTAAAPPVLVAQRSHGASAADAPPAGRPAAPLAPDTAVSPAAEGSVSTAAATPLAAGPSGSVATAAHAAEAADLRNQIQRLEEENQSLKAQHGSQSGGRREGAAMSSVSMTSQQTAPGAVIASSVPNANMGGGAHGEEGTAIQAGQGGLGHASPPASLPVATPPPLYDPRFRSVCWECKYGAFSSRGNSIKHCRGPVLANGGERKWLGHDGPDYHHDPRGPVSKEVSKRLAQEHKATYKRKLRCLTCKEDWNRCVCP